MDEVDKIIFHSLRQIGCTIENDDDVVSMSNFTPELLVSVVASCLGEIKPSITLPKKLPGSIAARFTVASTMAEACAGCGYRADIGYQTFLYPNAIDVRRLLMFLIEQLPKDNRTLSEPFQIAQTDYELLRKEIRDKMQHQLQMPWVPQYCRAVGNLRANGCSSQNVKFAPQLNLNIPSAGIESKEVQNYFKQQAPNVFKQTCGDEYDLISSVLHKNSLDLHRTNVAIDTPKYATTSTAAAKETTNTVTVAPSPADESKLKPALSTLSELSESINSLKTQNDKLLSEQKSCASKISLLKQEQSKIEADVAQLHKQIKINERTGVVLENPNENVEKLETLVQTTLQRRKTLEQQWQTYRAPMLENLERLKNAKLAKNVESVSDLRIVIAQLEENLREKTAIHAKLTTEAKRTGVNAAPRIEYTRRIQELIGNIRKQRNDIVKVLDDTRDLQKQLNSVSAQLQRQFNYTDDRLFQSAKHDLHAKRAYQLLAALHTTCNQLVEVISETGNITKESRDLEVEIDREKLKNTVQNLEKISADIRNFENVVRGIQTEIRKVENEITAG